MMIFILFVPIVFSICHFYNASSTVCCFAGGPCDVFAGAHRNDRCESHRDLVFIYTNVSY